VPPQRLPALALAAAFFAGAPARAESGLLVDVPTAFGTVQAATYDVRRERVGGAHVVIEQLEEGRVRLLSESGFTAGARTVLSALLERADGNGHLRPLLQESRSFDADGSALGILSIDHAQRRATCTRADGTLAGELALPERDRVANLTLSLLFLPLVRREQDELSFQIFLCGSGPRLVDFVANLSPASRNGKRPALLEVRYGPDLGLASLVARNFIPKLSVWFDPDAPHPWMAHRVPLYGSGPEVFVVRDGVPTRWLSDD
jgi:hypothetical protein